MSKNSNAVERRKIKIVDTVREAAQNVADETDNHEAADIEENKGISALAYLGILFFLPLVACPKSNFGRFHANQGLVFRVFVILAIVAVSVVGSLFTWRLKLLTDLIRLIVGVAGVYIWVTGIKNAMNGLAKELPFIGKIRFFK